jgi:chemotaxis protein MotB
MNRALRLLVLFAVVLLASGCVTKKKHQQQVDAAAARHAAIQKDLDGERAKLAELQAKLEADAKAAADRLAALDARRAELEQRIADMEKDRGTLQGELATLLKDRSALKGSVEEMQRALDELARRKAESDSRVAEFRKLLERFKGLIDAGKLKVKIVDGRMVVALATDVLFSSGSATLSPEGKSAIGEVAVILASIPDRKYQVEGHTDDVPIKTAQYPSNWELASGRALTVVKTMIESGVPADRISGAAFAESKPAVANKTQEGRAANRRIEIVVVPDLSSLPGFDELNRAAAAK